MRSRELTFLIVGMVLASIAGVLVGEVVASFLPEGSNMQTLLRTSKQIGFGQGVGFESTEPTAPTDSTESTAPTDSTGSIKRIEPFRIDLYGISVVLGLTLRINLVSVLFVLMLFIYFRWWYL